MNIKKPARILKIAQKLLFSSKNEKDFLLPLFYMISFLINSELVAKNLYAIILRVCLSMILSLLIRFKKKRHELSILASLYWFWEGLIFLNLEFFLCGFRSSFFLFPMVRFMTISALILQSKSQKNKKLIFLLSYLLLALNMIFITSKLNVLGLPALLIDLTVFYYFFFSSTPPNSEKPLEKNNENISEMLNFLPMGFIIVNKGKKLNEYSIRNFNDQALNLLGVERKDMTVPFLVSEMRTFRLSKLHSDEKKIEKNSSSWSFHEFQDCFEKTEDLFLLRLKKNIFQAKPDDTLTKISETLNILSRSPNSENYEKNQNSTAIDFRSKKVAFDLKISIKHSKNHALIYIFITDIDFLEELKSQNEVKTRLINSFSHELKTPLNASIPMLELCKEEKKFNEFYIEKVICCLKLLELALNNILDYSLILSEEFILNFSRFKLSGIINDIHEIVLEKLKIKDLTFDCNIAFELHLNSDYVRLKQILLNLVLNSIQFTEKGKISIEIKKLEETPLKIKFTVRDTGIGISAEKLVKLKEFLNFNTEIPINSTGSCLGLIISNNIAVLLGGDPLIIDSEVTKGTTVSFSLLDQNTANQTFDKDSVKNETAIILEKKPESLIEKTVKKTTAIIEASRTFNSSRKNTEENIQGNMNFKSVDFLNVVNWENLYYHHSEKILPKYNRFDRLTSIDQPLERMTSDVPNSIGQELDLHNFENLIEFKTDTMANRLLSESDELPVFIFDTIAQKMCHCPQVLIVDDDPFNLLSLELLLKRLGFSCLKASNGQMALNIMLNNRGCGEECLGIQLILMDYQMPVLDGVETTKRIKVLIQKGEINKNVKVVGCTAFCAKTEAFRMMEAGMSDVIFKPVKIDILEEVLNRFVKLRLF